MLAFDFPLKKSIKSAALTVTNSFHSQQLAALGDKISDVKQIKQELQSTGFFSPPVLQMISAGEKSNNLERVLEEISKFYEKDFNRSLYKFMSLVEVLAIIFVGIFVGGVVISMYLPIFKMAGAFA
jgi:type IV pilus assembly protein PilC